MSQTCPQKAFPFTQLIINSPVHKKLFPQSLCSSVLFHQTTFFYIHSTQVASTTMKIFNQNERILQNKNCGNCRREVFLFAGV